MLPVAAHRRPAGIDELLHCLEGLAVPEAVDLAREARDLAEVLRGWGVRRPHPDVRLDTINRVLGLNVRAIEFLAGLAPPAPRTSSDATTAPGDAS
jgi:hypothetical protein